MIEPCKCGGVAVYTGIHMVDSYRCSMCNYRTADYFDGDQYAIDEWNQRQIEQRMTEVIMATWDFGGGCSCGVEKYCNCGRQTEEDRLNIEKRKKEMGTWTAVPTYTPTQEHSNKERELGFFEGVSRCLNILNTFEDINIDKRLLYKAFMDLRLNAK